MLYSKGGTVVPAGSRYGLATGASPPICYTPLSLIAGLSLISVASSIR
jgi:hypothetical protein